MNKYRKGFYGILLLTLTMLFGMTAQAKTDDTIKTGIYAGDVELSGMTAQEAEEFLKTKYPEVVIEKREMYVKEHKPQENTQYISSKSIDTEYSYASYVFYGTMDTPDAKGDSVIIYMSDSGKSPYYAVKDSTDKDDAKWQMSIVQNKSGNAKTWDYAFKEK